MTFHYHEPTYAYKPRYDSIINLSKCKIGIVLVYCTHFMCHYDLQIIFLSLQYIYTDGCSNEQSGPASRNAMMMNDLLFSEAFWNFVGTLW